MEADTTFDERARRETAQIRRALADASHVPSHYYASDEVFRIEQDRMFRRDWLCAGRIEEIPAPGDFFTVDVIDEPVIVARGDDGAIRAFSSLCLHRGVAVANGRGNTKRFTCPYHAWTYDLAGGLIGAPHMKDAAGFDPARCRLPPIAVDFWDGWIFICLADQPEPFERFIGEFAREFAFLRQQDCRLAARLEFNLDCNWKFVVENFLDVYHAMVVHAGSFGKYREAVDYFPDTTGQRSLFGYYNSAALVPGGKSLFGNMPWLADKPPTFACLGHLAPNLQLFGRCDNLIVDIIWPVAPDKTRLWLHILFPKEHFERPDFAEKLQVYRDFQTQVIEEDRALVTALQRATRSRKFVPGRLSRLEHGIYNLANHHLDRLLGDPKP